jgi:hypothetical protein
MRLLWKRERRHYHPCYSFTEEGLLIAVPLNVARNLTSVGFIQCANGRAVGLWLMHLQLYPLTL